MRYDLANLNRKASQTDSNSRFVVDNNNNDTFNLCSTYDSGKRRLLGNLHACSDNVTWYNVMYNHSGAPWSSKQLILSPPPAQRVKSISARNAAAGKL
jgi:hypothetical protein